MREFVAQIRPKGIAEQRLEFEREILAEYFGIDLQEVERERRMILRGMQEAANNL